MLFAQGVRFVRLIEQQPRLQPELARDDLRDEFEQGIVQILAGV